MSGPNRKSRARLDVRLEALQTKIERYRARLGKPYTRHDLAKLEQDRTAIVEMIRRSETAQSETA